MPSSDKLLTQVVPVKVPDMPSVFGLPPAATDEAEEPSETHHSLTDPVDCQQLFQPISQAQPVNPPLPPPKSQPVYSSEVGKISQLFISVDPLMTRPYSV